MATGYMHERPAGPPIGSPEVASLSTTSVPRSSALSSKITTVLSASYADLEIRDALETLDERGIENTPETRRQLRLGLQREVIECNGEVIKEFGQIAEQVRRIGDVVASLNERCKEMKSRVSAAHRETAPTLEEASSVLRQKQQVETKQQLLQAFNKHFMVPEDDLLALTSSAEPVNDRFFAALAKVKKIHRDCQILLGFEDQRLGLEIMEQSSRNLNSAFQKLYRWIQREFKTLNLENPQISSAVRHALRVLAERPTLFQSCLDFFAEAREHILSDSLQAALTGNSNGVEQTSAKPIELFAYDPLRYIGDMLAWTHSTTVSEREALEVLFISDGDEIAKGIQAGIDSEPWARPEGDGEVFDGRKALDGLVSRDLAGVARVLRQRIEQVIQGHEESTLAYRIANLIDFYRVTFSRLLGEDSSLLSTLDELQESALRQFRATLKDHVLSVQNDLSAAPQDLKPPEFLTEALEQLTTLMKTFETSLSPPSTRETVFQPILAAALDPYLEACDTLAKEIPGIKRTIFIINVLLTARHTLEPFSFTTDKLSDIDETIEEQQEKLVNHQHAFFLHTSGLHALVEALDQLPKDDISVIPTLQPFQPAALSATSETLDDFLPSALMDAVENLAQLGDKEMVRRVTEEAAGKFCDDFGFVKGRIIAVDEALENDEDEDEQGTSGLKSLFPRTEAEIRVLLS